ncbi:dihydrodipicolinate synthase family protein [Pyxidicoccus fallax]|uniref:Dihydrodipicolinate synthase family protein n=1 Tax=Pyxidicoccus fallax TaxID=394095 RepID=A0A848LQQ1_9BACT|nr:dihydrodipicolinate synthase family protein [Pyxidicoccus fallax]NMO19883.1 dihydrodipicolinate synthase family protein [Pyxidicoccus fallax]NPC80536.1 dihydrodipicolinate synthase family protein [Pyxidicoccus fallax]
MSRHVPLHGIIGYTITPFQEDGRVDLGTLQLLTDRMAGSGVHAIAPLGSTGSLPYLDDGEREAVIEATMKAVRGRVPVLAGVSSLTTERTLHHARFAERAGAAAVMVIPMSYWKLTEEEIFRHFDRIASALSIPIMAYNNPATGGLDMTPEFLARLLQIPNVTMVKESTGDVGRMHRLRQVAGEDVAFYNGSNPLALAAFAAGARGWCTAAPALIPELNLRLYREVVQKGDLAAARKVFQQQLPLLQFIVKGGLPRTIAAGLELRGTRVGPLRAPLLPLPETEREALRRILEKLEV